MTTIDPAAVKVAKHAAESGHWYRRDGSQVETVPSADGTRQVKCTLVHAKKLDLARGITSVLKLVDKPALTNWRIEQAILAALTLGRLDGETDEAFVERVKEDGAQQAANAAEEGTRIHAAIQAHFQGAPYSETYRPHVEGVLRVLPTDGGTWRTEVGVASPRGYGTKIDLINDKYLLDFKGKDGDQAALDGMKTYDEHAMQLAACEKAAIEGFEPACGKLASNERECGIVFVSRTHPGAASVRWIYPADLIRAWSLFKALLTYCHEKDGHTPFSKEF